MKKRTKRAVWLKLPPKGLRPKVPQVHQDSMNLMVIDFVDQIARGVAPVETMWDYCRSVFTISVMAERMELGAPEMAAQVKLCTRLVQRWEKTGRVLFTGEDLVLARDGTEVMRQIVEAVDEPTAFLAVQQSADRLRAAMAPIGVKVPKESL